MFYKMWKRMCEKNEEYVKLINELRDKNTSLIHFKSLSSIEIKKLKFELAKREKELESKKNENSTQTFCYYIDKHMLQYNNFLVSNETLKNKLILMEK